MKEIIAEFARNETIRQVERRPLKQRGSTSAHAYRHRPNISPVTAAVSVKPGKYAPVGNASEPMRVAQRGDERRPSWGRRGIAHSAIAAKPSPIFHKRGC